MERTAFRTAMNAFPVKATAHWAGGDAVEALNGVSLCHGLTQGTCLLGIPLRGLRFRLLRW